MDKRKSMATVMRWPHYSFKRGMSCSKKSDIIIISSNILSPTLPSFLLGLCYTNVKSIVPSASEVLFTSFPSLFFPLFRLVISVLPSRSLILSSVVFILLLSPSSEFSKRQLVCFSILKFPFCSPILSISLLRLFSLLFQAWS